MASINDGATRDIPNVTMALRVKPDRVPHQDITELQIKLGQLAPTTRQPYQPGAGLNLRPDILVEIILEHVTSGAIEALVGLAGAGVLELMKRVIQMLRQQSPTTHEQQAPTISIVLQNSPVTIQNVTVSISTQALPLDLLDQVPDQLTDLPRHLSQPPLSEHRVEHVTVPVGFLPAPIQYEDAADPLRYWLIQNPTLPRGFAVFDTHTNRLIDPYASDDSNGVENAASH